MNRNVYKLLSILPDKTYIKIQYFYLTKRKLDLKNPKRFNEKLQWLKLYDRKPEYTTLVDKYKVREYISKVIGEKYLIPLLGVWDTPEEINFEKLPNQFVLKCNHDSKSVIICKNKNKLNQGEIIKHFKRCLKYNAFDYGREWPYKNVDAKIIAEKFMIDESGGELKDYKVMCFNGEPKLIQVHENRFKGKNMYTMDYYDINWNKLDIKQSVKTSDHLMNKPFFLKEMLELSQILSEDIPLSRVDWYYTNNQLYFGEITFYPTSGYEEFEPEKYNNIIGDWIKLPIEK